MGSRMKVYCLMIFDYPEQELDSVYKSWADAYDAATLSARWSIQVYDLETNYQVGEEYWIIDGRYGSGFHYRPQYSKNVDPTEEYA
jgi:hypothetical protein